MKHDYPFTCRTFVHLVVQYNDIVNSPLFKPKINGKLSAAGDDRRGLLCPLNVQRSVFSADFLLSIRISDASDCWPL